MLVMATIHGYDKEIARLNKKTIDIAIQNITDSKSAMLVAFIRGII